MKLYIYDHCPYCVKARMIFGLKNIPVQLVCLLNDDEKTLFAMIGQKMVPVLEHSPGQFMPESLDIIRYVDKKHPPALVSSWKEDKALFRWLQENSTLIYNLAMPRWVKAPLEEFQTRPARDYFQNKKEQSIGPFEKALKNTRLKQKMAMQLMQLNHQLPEKSAFLKGSISVNDFHLLAALRSLTIVKNLNWPKNVRYYMEKLAAKSHIPLHDDIAL